MSNPQAPTSSARVLALDGGQSGTTLKYVDSDGEIVFQAAGVLTDRPLMPQAETAVRAFLAEHDVAVDRLGVTLSGLVTPEADELLGRLSDTTIAQVSVAHDSTASYLGALGDNPGVVTACGTGVVTLAMGAHEIARVDGWGWIMGDAGSAYWIGRNALEAAMRGYDGRRQMTALTARIEEDFEDLEAAYIELQSDPNRVQRVASYAVVVDQLAASDAIANNILSKAAAHLAEAVIAAAHRVSLLRVEPPRVCALGSVFESSRVVHAFTEYLTLQWPNFALTEPVGRTVDGAAMLVHLPDTSPMAARVAHARR